MLFHGHPDVVDADLSDYFGSIPHAELLQSVARRIVDRRVLYLIKQWLECPVEESDKRGAEDGARRWPRTAGAGFRKAHQFHHYWRICTCVGSCWGGSNAGWSERIGSRIVTYADDLVILCQRGKADEALQHMHARSWGKLKLTVNEEKTRICKIPEERVRFSGFHVWADVFAAYGTGPSWPPAVEEEASSTW